MDKRFYNLSNARAFLEAAYVCLRHAGKFLTGDRELIELYARLRTVRKSLEELLSDVENRLGSYLPKPRLRDDYSDPRARRIILEVLSSG